MADQGAKYTDKELAKVEKKIKEIYSEAQKDIQKKIKDYESKFVTKNKIYLEKLDNGEITYEQYSAWLDGQIFQGEQWEAKRDQIIHVIQNANKEAAKIVNGGSISVFAENANWSSYNMEHTEGVNFGFGLYDAKTVTNLIKNDPQLLPKWKINEPKDYVWNKKKVNNSITQGIIQGERLDQIATRLATGLKANNMNTMLTFARTAMTGAQNAGRNQSLMDAKNLGINVVKVWMATLDDHTRLSHQQMDGEEQKVGDTWHPMKFSNGCRYPGDPMGPPHEVYNCRCTLVSDVKDYPSEYNRYDNIEGEPIKNMTYQEWKEAKESGTGLEPWTPPTSFVESMFPVGFDTDSEEAIRKQEFTNDIMLSPTVNQMTPAQLNTFENEVLANMSNEHLEMYKTMTDFHGASNYTSGGGWYSPSKHIVEMNLSANRWEQSVGRSNANGAWKTKFHEELHQLDHIMGITQGWGRWSSITACEHSIWGTPTPIGKRLQTAITQDILGIINKAIDNTNKADAMAASMLGVKPSKPMKHVTDLNKPITRDIRNSFFAYLSEQTQGDDEHSQQYKRAMLSPFTDAVGLMTKNRIDPYSNGYWGHPPKYQKEQGANGATSECFAEIGSHIMRNDTEALDFLSEWMPNSIAEYRDVISELAEYMRDNQIHY